MTKNPHAVALGRKGGLAKGPAKARTRAQAQEAARARWAKVKQNDQALKDKRSVRLREVASWVAAMEQAKAEGKAKFKPQEACSMSTLRRRAGKQQ